MTRKKATTPRHVDELRQDPQNARIHTEANLDMLRRSFEENGAGRSILIDEENQIIAGNGAVQGAANAGITKVRVIDAQRDEIIAVRRRDLTPEQKQRMALFDNRTAELAEWDEGVLATLEAEGVLLGDLFDRDTADADPLTLDEGAEPEPMTVEPPADVAWILVALPLAKWPAHQEAVRKLTEAAEFSSMVLRPRAGR